MTVGTTDPDADSVAPDVETLPDDDPYLDEPFLSSINAVKIGHHAFTPSADVYSDQEAIPVNQVATQPPHIDQEDPPDVFRAAFDTGAFATCTDRLDMLHDVTWFSDTNPCPVRLKPATHGSDTVPQAVGYLHVPARNALGFLPVRCFYCQPPYYCHR